MAKLVNVQDSLYKLSVNPGGTITLNTGDQIGKVVITGNVDILGELVTIQTTNLDIEDNIIFLNKGETGSGITERTSGIQIDRGSRQDAQFFFDEDRTWLDTQTSSTLQGLFVFKRAEDNRLVGIQTNSITADGYDLNLLGNDTTGTAVIHVNGVNDYERRVLDYTLPGLPPKNDDTIPNIRAVVDYVVEYFDVNPPFKIQDSRIINGVTELSDSLLEVKDFDSDGVPSQLILTLDNSVNAVWYTDRFESQSMRFSNSSITGLGFSTDLVLSNPGTGSVKINDDLKIAVGSSNPAVAADGVKVYAKQESIGGTGLYFVNTRSTEEATTTRDELVSRRKALAFSMIF
jgi:hypothetical protein